MSVLYTIGHSNHQIDEFIKLLNAHQISALVDVRSHPYSRHFPQFCKQEIKNSLMAAGIEYVYLGMELGARSNNPACYLNGKVQYDLLAKDPLFSKGIQRLLQGMEKFNIALMCAEKDPLQCHRAILVARQIFQQSISVQHIHADGSLENHADLEIRMMELNKISDVDMFRSKEEILQDAYKIHGQKIAYQDEAMLKEELTHGAVI